MEKKKQSFNGLQGDISGASIRESWEPRPPRVNNSEVLKLLKERRAKREAASLETAEKKPLQEIIEARLEKIA